MNRDGLFPDAQMERASPVAMDLPYACHRRILRHCRALRTLRRHVAECGQSLEAQMVSHVLLRFFDNEVPQHYDDEEQDLFPALIHSMGGSEAAGLRELTRRAAEQHRALAAEWDRLRTPLEQVAAGRSILLPSQDVEAFARRWNEQIGREEAGLLPMASRLLSGTELAVVHRRMQGCRRCFRAG